MKCTARGGIDGGRLPRCSDGELARAISETQNPDALYSYSNKLRRQKCYELANMSHDYATRIVRKQNKKRA